MHAFGLLVTCLSQPLVDHLVSVLLREGEKGAFIINI